jgi:hypothetical protein
MVCTSPISLKHLPDLKFRCRKCLSCQITKRQEWAMRCTLELDNWEEASFLTLTFSNDNVPKHGVNVSDIQKFMKYLRKEIYPKKVKYMACGEYGTGKGSRKWFEHPHYHIILFGYDFPDKEIHSLSKKSNEPLYTSKLLDKCWKNQGMAMIGEVTHASASYVAGYIHKKFNNTCEKELEHYGVLDDGVVRGKEFNCSSKGLGQSYYDKYKAQLHNHDYIIYQGKKYGLPEYYNYLIKKEDKEKYDELKYRRSKYKKNLDFYEAKAKDYILKQKFSKQRNIDA